MRPLLILPTMCLGNAADTVTQLSVAIQAVPETDFAQPASSAVSLLKHDAAAQMAALATAAADFLEAGSTDLTQLDISAILTLADTAGIAAQVAANVTSVESYRSTLGGMVEELEGLFAGATIGDGGVFTFPAGAARLRGVCQRDYKPLSIHVLCWRNHHIQRLDPRWYRPGDSEIHV